MYIGITAYTVASLVPRLSTFGTHVDAMTFALIKHIRWVQRSTCIHEGESQGTRPYTQYTFYYSVICSQLWREA